MKSLACAALAALASVASADFDLKKNRPVSKVITLLKDMKAQLEKEQEDDQKIYDKMACWCKANRKGKAASIKEAEAKIAKTMALIEEGTGKIGQYEAEIKQLDAELAENKESLEMATKLRKEKNESFNKTETDLVQSIAGLKSALVVLEKHNSPGNLLQEKDMNNIIKMVQHTAEAHKGMVDENLMPSSQRLLSNLLEVNQPSYADYSSQSGEIFGILKDMLDTFESNLKEARETETAEIATFKELKEAKEAEITAGTEQLNNKQQHFAEVKEAVANGKQSIATETASIEADRAFLANVEEKCKMTDFEFENRQKTRAEEIVAVGEALKVLSDDDAHDLFTRTFNPESFLQMRKVKAVRDTRRSNAIAVLKKFPALAAITSKMKLDAFTKVKAEIDKMVATLKEEKKAEEKQRDHCIKELHDTEMDHTKTTRVHEDSFAKMELLETQIDNLGKEIEDLHSQIDEDNKQLKELGEDRAEENAEFQTTEKDQNDTIALLTKASNVLKEFYEKKQIANNNSGVAVVPDFSFVQVKQEPEKDGSYAPGLVGSDKPEGFDTYQKNAGGTGVMALLQQIISEAKALLVEARRDEADAQKMYETTVKDTNDSIEKKNRDITAKTEEKSVAEQDHTAAKKDYDDAGIQLTALEEREKALHQQCDFLLKNFDARQAAFDDEIGALGQAKAILSGSDFQAAVAAAGA